MELRACPVVRRWLQAMGRALAPQAYSVILFGALFCNLAAKLFHAGRYGLPPEYPSWICTDVGVLMLLEAVLAMIVYRRPTKSVIRVVLVLAAVVCAWSVMNAGWLIRTGTQILPVELWPLLRDPLNISWIIINLARMPGAAAVLLVPSIVALAWFFPVLARAVPPAYKAGRFRIRVVGSLVVALGALGCDAAVSNLGSTPVAAAGLRFNCQLRGVLAFVLPEYRHVGRSDFKNATRQLPRYDGIAGQATPRRISRNVMIVVLEGIQYDYTSLAMEQGGIAPQTGDHAGGPTPYLSTLAAAGASFTSARAVVTHTTKALFALLTGRVPSTSQDIIETVPVDRPYASLATILRDSLGYRTAFFQSAKGTFESRPGLVHNLGFEKFWTREDLNDPNQFLGYLGCDEFALLAPMRRWIQSQDKPFLLVALCSVTHDPHQVPPRFGEKVRDQGERYLQTVSYTDRFLAALDAELAGVELHETQARKISDEIMAWRKGTIFRPETVPKGKTELFGTWLWKDNGHVSRMKNTGGR